MTSAGRLKGLGTFHGCLTDVVDSVATFRRVGVLFVRIFRENCVIFRGNRVQIHAYSLSAVVGNDHSLYKCIDCSAAMSGYAVVEFLGESTVEVIPESWVKKGNAGKGMVAFWPPDQVATKIKEGDIGQPDYHSWMELDVRVVRFAESYDKGLHYAQAAVEASSSKTNDDDMPRKRRRLTHYNPVPCPEGGQQQEEASMEATANGGAGSSSNAAEEPVAGRCATTTTTPSTTQAPTKTESDADRTSTPVRRPSVSGQETLFEVTSASTTPFGTTPSERRYQEPDGMAEFQRRVLLNQERIVELLDENKRLLFGYKIPSAEDVGDFLEEQVDGVEEMETLCQRIIDKNERRKLVSFLSKHKGRNIGKSVRNMLQRVGTFHLWSQYSLQGRKGKKRFMEMEVCRAIITAALCVHHDASVATVETAIGEFLKHAPEKVKHLKEKSASSAVGFVQKVESGGGGVQRPSFAQGVYQEEAASVGIP